MPTIHHLNCASFCPLCEKLNTGQGSWFKRASFCTHCLLVEDTNGLVLIDTGLGSQDIANPERLGLAFRLAMQPTLNSNEIALAQVKRLGYHAKDIQHIGLTHLDLDHAGGLHDFAHANVHVQQQELNVALKPRTLAEKSRYRPYQFKHQPRWQAHQSSEADIGWFGFKGAYLLPNLQTEILMIPLAGHTRGHMGFAINTGRKWLLHVGDMVMNSKVLRNEPTPASILPFIENQLADDNTLRLENVARVKALYLNHSAEVDIICSHDMQDYLRFAE